jgi:hypothetical protein
MSPFLAACGGFLLAVLWMDLIFDVQVLAYESKLTPLPEKVLASIASYYRRVTKEADPMRQVVGLILILALGGSLYQAVRSSASPWLRMLPLLLCGSAIGLTVFRIFPNAARLGARVDPVESQSELARSIFRGHVFCFICIGIFVAVQLCWQDGPPR